MERAMPDSLTTKDHDLLIRLEAKLDQVSIDVKDLKDGTTHRISLLESRMDKMEAINTEVKPKEMAEMIQIHDRWIGEQKINIRWTMAIASSIGGLVGFLLSQLSNIINLINKTH